MNQTYLTCFRGGCNNTANPCGYNRVTHGMYCIPCARRISAHQPADLYGGPLFPLLKHRSSVTPGGSLRAGIVTLREKQWTSQRGDGARTFYVGGRFKSVDLVRAAMVIMMDAGYTVTYDWTNDGSRRGNPEAMAELSPIMVDAAGSATKAVFLLTNGEKSPQAGTHCELGAALHGGADVFIATPREHAYLLDPSHPRCKSFYCDERATRHVYDGNADLLAAIKAWAA